MIRLFFIALIFITALLASTAWWLWHDKEKQLNSPLNISTPTTYTINAGEHLQGIAEDLASKGWIKQPYYLVFEARRLKKTAQIKAGEYEVLPGTTPMQLLDLFISGKVIQYSLTLVEGWTFQQIKEAVQNNPILEQTIDDWSPKSVMTTLGQPDTLPEGYFFPDTYLFPRGTKDIDFLARTLNRLQTVLAEEWEQRSEGLPYASAYEALIMASIIEKETGVPEERAQIAGVFVRRLEKGMKLQTDPTVIYAIGQSFDGDIRRKDLSIDSPYNTYVYKGLPPTPIALAGREAIHAALHPQAGESLYFVAKGDGSHYFSNTLKEHNRAVTKYQLNKK